MARTKSGLKRQFNDDSRIDSEDEVNNRAGTSRNVHLTYLRTTPMYENDQHVSSPKRAKPDNEKFCWWKNEKGETIRNCCDKDIMEFVEKGITPDGAVSINFNGEYVAKTESRRPHLYSNSCLLTGIYTNGKIEVEIKISAMSSLGKREWKVSEKGIKGCVPILNLYQIGEYNVFVRSMPGDRLDDIITGQDDEAINPRKCASDLAGILKNMHKDHMFVRFIVPQNIVFIKNHIGQNEVMFEEFNTLTFDKSVATSDFQEDTSSNDEFSTKVVENMLLSRTQKKNMNTGKVYSVADEIKSLGYVISQLGTINQDYCDLSEFGDTIRNNKYTLKQIEIHPAVQTIEKYYSYVDTLSSWLLSCNNNITNLNKRFNTYFNKPSKRFETSTFCESVFTFYNNHYDRKKMKMWDPDMAFLKNPSASSFIITLSHIHKNCHTVHLHPNWKRKFASRDLFLKRLRTQSVNMIEKIHQVVLLISNMFDVETREQLCIPE